MSTGTIMSASTYGPPHKRADTRRRLSLRARIFVLAAIWTVAIVPLLFLRNEWFGRPLSDQQIGEYLHAEDSRLVQHALAQISDRVARHDPSVNIWYSDLVRLSTHPDADVRSMDATVMGNAPSIREFHRALLTLLRDGSHVVRCRAALSLVSFGDVSGHDEIAAMLQPWAVQSPGSGRIRDMARPGAWVRQGALVARISSPDGVRNVYSPVSGRVQTANFKSGDEANASSELLTVDPGPETVTEALIALARIGRAQDLPLVVAFESQVVADRVRRQAVATEEAIRLRANR